MEDGTRQEGTTHRRRHHGLWMGLGVGALVLAGLTWIAPKALAWHGGAGPGAFRGGHAALLEDPEQARERAAFAVEWAMKTVAATPDQQDRAQRIARRLVDEMVPVAEGHRARREAIAAELTKPQIDREALERLRAAQVEDLAEASKRLTRAVADLAEVLTPEQRTELLDMVHRAHGLRRH